jgi:hypothetical protein
MYRKTTPIFVRDFPDRCLKMDVSCKIKTKRFWPFKDRITLTLYGYINRIDQIETELAEMLKLVI